MRRLPPQQSENIVIAVSMHKNNVIDKSEIQRNLVMFATTCIPPRFDFILVTSEVTVATINTKGPALNKSWALMLLSGERQRKGQLCIILLVYSFFSYLHSKHYVGYFYFDMLANHIQYGFHYI